MTITIAGHRLRWPVRHPEMVRLVYRFLRDTFDDAALCRELIVAMLAATVAPVEVKR